MAIEFNNAPSFNSLDANLKARLVTLIHDDKETDAETVLTILGYTNVAELIKAAKQAEKEAAVDLEAKDLVKSFEAALVPVVEKMSLPADLAGQKYDGLVVELRYNGMGKEELVSASQKIPADTWFVNLVGYRVRAVDEEGNLTDGHNANIVHQLFRPGFNNGKATGATGRKRSSGAGNGKSIFKLKDAEGNSIATAKYFEETYPEKYKELSSGNGRFSANREIIRYLDTMDSPSDPVVQAALAEAGYSGSLKEMIKALRTDKGF